MPEQQALDDAHRKMALEVHLAEYAGLRSLVDTHIGQDRAILGTGVVIIGVLGAALGAIASKSSDKETSELSVVLWFVIAITPSLLSFVGIMEARTIQAGIEVNAYIVRHLGPAIEKLVFDQPPELQDRPLMSEHFFPRIDSLHLIGSKITIDGTSGPVRLLSGAARVALFGLPSLLAIALVSLGPYGFDQLQFSSQPLPIRENTEWLLRILVAASVLTFLSMMTSFVLTFLQMDEYTSWTHYQLTRPPGEVSSQANND